MKDKPDDLRDEVTPVHMRHETNGTNGSGSDPHIPIEMLPSEIARLNRADEKRRAEVDTLDEKIATVMRGQATLARRFDFVEAAVKRIGSRVLALSAVGVAALFVGSTLGNTLAALLIAGIKSYFSK